MSEIKNLLTEAMNSELEAKKFYNDAAEKALSQAGKNLFSQLAEFEQNHYEKVKKIIESLDTKIEMKLIHSQDITKKINPEIQGEIEPNKDEIVTVIHLAIQSEKKAQERYTRIAEMLKGEDNKKIFYNLAQDERNHQKILEDEFYHLSNKGIIIWD